MSCWGSIQRARRPDGGEALCMFCYRCHTEVALVECAQPWEHFDWAAHWVERRGQEIWNMHRTAVLLKGGPVQHQPEVERVELPPPVTVRYGA